MSIEVREVKSAKEIKDFVELPYKLYKDSEFWVPPMKSDEKKALLPSDNPAFEFSKAKFWVAYKEGKCVGRIGGIIIPIWVEKTGEKKGRFTRAEFIDNEEVVNKLIATVEAWIKSEGMEGMHGPLGFSNLDHQGLLIQGQEWLPSVASDYHHEYYKKHFARLGFEKERDWLEFRVTFPEAMPEKSFKVADMLKRRYGLTSVNFSTKAELVPYREKIFEVFNEAFSQLFGTFELPKRLVDYYIDKFFPMLNPRYVKVILDKEKKLAGFIVAMPSLSVAMKKAGGKLWPFGWYHLKKALDKPVEMDLMLTGVRPELQKLGLVSLLMNELWLTANADGIKYVETTGMLEDNHVAIQMWKSFEHVQHKRKRCYKKMF